MLNSAVQAVLNATDTWFVGRLSPGAISAMGAVYWPVLVFILLFGGIALSVQTLVAHAYGAGRYARASQATWTGLWGALLVVPLFTLLAASGRALFSPFGLPPATLDLALAYWFPRMLGAPLGIALYAVLGFFNGIGRPTITLRVTLVVAVANAILNQLFIFGFGLGVAGSAWATGVAQLCGLSIGFAWFYSPANRAALPLAPHEPVRAAAAPAPDFLGISHGSVGSRGHSRIRTLSAHAGSARQRRWRFVPDRAHAHLVLLHARGGSRHGRYDARGTVDRSQERPTGREPRATASFCWPFSTWASWAWVLPRWDPGFSRGSRKPRMRKARRSWPKAPCSCGSPRDTSSSTVSTSRAARVCGERAMYACPRSWCSAFPGRCSCRSRTRYLSSRGRDGSTGCRNTAWARWEAGSPH